MIAASSVKFNYDSNQERNQKQQSKKKSNQVHPCNRYLRENTNDRLDKTKSPPTDKVVIRNSLLWLSGKNHIIYLHQ